MPASETPHTGPGNAPTVRRYDSADGAGAAEENEAGGGRRKWLLIGAGLLLLGGIAATLLYVLRPRAPQAQPPPQTPLVETVAAEVRSGALQVEVVDALGLALQLQVGDLSLTVVGLLKTKLPDTDGYSLLLLVTAELPPIRLGFGFTLNGIDADDRSGYSVS